MFVSVVIPVYDSPALDELVARIDAVFTARPGDRYEVVFVDDRSPDPAVWAALERLAVPGGPVRALQLTRNFGQHAATLCGLRAARGDVVVTMDDDLQHDPADLPRLLAHAAHDVVIGELRAKRHGPLTRLTSRVKGWFDRLLIGKPPGLQLSAYRVLSRTVVDGVLAMRVTRPFLPALLFHVTRDVVGVPVDHHPRRGGRSGYTFARRLRLFTDLVIDNSSLVLRLVGYVGLAAAGASGPAAVLVVYRKLVHGIPVAGWASLFAGLLLFGGLTLFGLGVVGEYLIRIVERSERRPAYVVRHRRGID